jgi:hypothetical protein
MVSPIFRRFGSFICVCNQTVIKSTDRFSRRLVFNKVKDVYLSNEPVGEKAELKVVLLVYLLLS